MNAQCSYRCCAYQALATVFHSQELPPKTLWLVRAVQPRVSLPKALRVATRLGTATCSMNRTSASWLSGRFVVSAPQ